MRTRPLAAAIAIAILLTGCSTAGTTASDAPPAELRLGYFPNLTHAPALVGVEDGYFQTALGSQTKLTGLTFNAGPAAIEALFAGSIDAAFIGPNPTVTGFTQSKGEALTVIAGAAANGAALIVRDGINTIEDLKGTTLATPQLGNTQDVALRYFLKQNGFATTLEGGGDVSIQPQDNATTLTTFQSGAIDGAWVPEPWATRLVQEGGGHVLVDEKTLWPDGQFVVTNLVVRTDYLNRYPGAVSELLAGLLASLDEIDAHPSDAKRAVNAQLEAITGKPIASAVLDAAWDNITFTWDPLPDTLISGAEHAKEVGVLDTVALDGLYRLDLLNALLAQRGAEAVVAP